MSDPGAAGGENERSARRFESLPDLLKDQAERWQRGEATSAESYLGKAPFLNDNPEALLDLIYNEILHREAKGETPRQEEYVQRFPHLARQLKAQFAVERMLADSQVTETPSRNSSTATVFSSSSTQVLEVPSLPGYE